MKPISLPLFVIVLGVLHQLFVWFVWYPLAGYSDVTLRVAQISFAILAIALLASLRIPVIRIGLTGTALLQATVGTALAYAFLLIVLLITNTLGGQVELFRQSYRPAALLDNWLLTGLGEELFFAGVLFNLLSTNMHRHRLWRAVMIIAVVFALWHLPGYLAIALRTGQFDVGILLSLLLNLVSWGIFGTIYLLSGNLWLTAFAHASTDYALLPVVTNAPALGLIFFFTLIGIAWWLGRQHSSVSVVVEETTAELAGRS